VDAGQRLEHHVGGSVGARAAVGGPHVLAEDQDLRRVVGHADVHPDPDPAVGPVRGRELEQILHRHPGVAQPLVVDSQVDVFVGVVVGILVLVHAVMHQDRGIADREGRVARDGQVVDLDRTAVSTVCTTESIEVVISSFENLKTSHPWLISH
jgi:hypothetical protein